MSNQSSSHDRQEEEGTGDFVLADVPIHGDDVGASLPSVEEARVDSGVNVRECGGEGDGCTRKWRIIAGLGVAFLVFVTVLGIGLGMFTPKFDVPGSSDYPSSYSSAQPNSTTTMNSQQQGEEDAEGSAGSEGRKADLKSVVSYLNAAGVSSLDDLQYEQSPQHQAALWLAERDELNLPLPVGQATTKVGYAYATRYVLAVLYYSMGGSGWARKHSFLTGREACAWNDPVKVMLGDGEETSVPGGVYCNSETGHISSIHLDNNNVKGNLPSELGFLTTLRLVAMNNNVVGGSFSEALCDIPTLRSIGLSHNSMSGPLPECMSRMFDLRVLFLSDNEFDGPLPDLSKLDDMVALLLDDNKLTGDVTVMFNNMKVLRHLYVEKNEFTGIVNENFLAGLDSLERVDISENQFVGSFPVHLLSGPKLQILDLHSNLLQGSFPEDIPSNSALQLLVFHQNQIEGNLPPALSNLQGLTHFDASSNKLYGPMPSELGDLTRLTYLFLAENSFDQGPVPDLSKLVSLKELSLKSTNRVGKLPDPFATLSNLVFLDLDNNGFEGSVPESWGQLSNLEYLLLNRNRGITGGIPQSFGQLSKLQTAFLDGTDIAGSLQPFCGLPAFAELNGTDNGGDNIISADCGGSAPKVTCTCCDLCCSGAEGETCNNNVGVANMQPEWESSFSRVAYEFGLDENFESSMEDTSENNNAR